MTYKKIKLAPNFGGPLHYLGSSCLSLPNLSGHMTVDHRWPEDMFSILNAHRQGKKYRKFYEPFAGSATLSFAAMELDLAESYVINDSDAILIETLRLIRDDPKAIKKNYERLSRQQRKAPHKKDFFVETIDMYNKANVRQKSLMLPFIINYSWGGIIYHDTFGNIIYRENSFSKIVSPGYLEEAGICLQDFFQK